MSDKNIKEDFNFESLLRKINNSNKNNSNINNNNEFNALNALFDHCNNKVFVDGKAKIDLKTGQIEQKKYFESRSHHTCRTASQSRDFP